MTHREDPNRGVYETECEFCSCMARCVLVMVDNRYHWKCVGRCGEWD